MIFTKVMFLRLNLTARTSEMKTFNVESLDELAAFMDE